VKNLSLILLGVALTIPCLKAGPSCPGSNIAPGQPGGPDVTLQILSGTSPCGNSSQGPLVLLNTLDPSWAVPNDGSSWVSYENSTCVGCSATTPQYDAEQAALGFLFVPTGTTVDFTQDFTIPSGYEVVGGSLQVYSDDQASINIVNSAYGGSGVNILPNDGNGHFCNCQIGPPPVNIVPIEMANGQFMGYLQIGQDNQFVFAITQGNGESSYGLDYALNLTLAPISVPEPASVSFVALGGLGLLWFKRRRR
jgi:hypothetical protein